MAFPTTSLLDALTTAGALSANWTTPTWGMAQTVQGSTGGALTTVAGSGSAYWSAATFGPDTEVYITCAAVSNAAVGLRMTNNGTSTAANLDGYVFQLNTGGSFCQIRKIVNNVYTNLGGPVTPPTLGAGDLLGFSAVGSTLTGYYQAAGSGVWQNLIQVTDTTYSAAGNIGFTIFSTTARVQNFSGGTVVSGSPPSNTVAPAITGTATVGSTLTTDNGTWTDNGSPTFTYQWQDSADNVTFADIVGQTASTYVIASGDLSKYARCNVTDTDANGSTTAASNSVGPIQAAATSGSAAGGHNFPLSILINS